MIEHIRKYTGLMIVIFVILFISFFFLDSSAMRNMGGGNSVIKVEGRTYSDKEFRTLGDGGLKLVQALAGGGDLGLYQFLMTLTSGATSREDGPQKFFVNRMIVRGAKDEFGVYPGDEQITNYLRGMKAFAGPDGKFDAATYQNFIDRYLGSMGLTEKDLRELASDVLAEKEISAIVGAGLIAPREEVARTFALQNQRITGQVAKVELAPYEAKIEPTEEEIKAYWETVSDAFTTEPRRKFTYILATPKVPEDTADEKEAPETIAEAAATEEARKAAAAKKEAEKAKRAADKADVRRKAQLETDQAVDQFLVMLEDQKGAGFEELAKENGWEPKTTEFFTKSTAPGDLALPLRSSSRGGTVADDLFRVQETSDPFSKISEAIAVGENQWLVARIDGVEESRPKTYPEARDEARAQYIAEKAAEAMKAAATEDAEKIRKAIADGKSFADAAKDAGIVQVKQFDAIISTYRPDGATEPQNLFEAAQNVDPGTVAEPIIETDRAFILHVEKREVVKEADAAKLESEVASATNRNEMVAFISWLAARSEAGEVQLLNRR